ncbi:hypothetical protein CFP56_020096 [Quercus suber]|uniref:Uncharacterized protein n=1 Tax=Quercus suber TaxID=58331 RepID=A0AAW0KIA5_QUESU
MSKENKPEEAEAVSQDLSVDDQPPFDNRFAMLHLNAFNCHNHHQHQHQPCNTCGCLCSTSNPMKRRSPSPSSSFQDPLNAFSSDSSLSPRGSSKTRFSAAPFRPGSFPIWVGFSSTQPQQFPVSRAASEVDGYCQVVPVTPSSNPGLPPLPPTLRRTISDPNPSPAKTIQGPRNNSAQDFEESVFVERVGEEGLTVHFKCPCGKGYQILLSGRNCYYKLM